MGKSFHTLALGLLTTSILPGAAFAQATIRPVPSIALAWEGGTTTASAMRTTSKMVIEADLTHITPLEPQAAPADSGDSTSFAELELMLDVLPNSSFQGGSGDVATQRGGWKASFGEWSPSSTSYAIELGTEASFYDYGPGSALSAGVVDPFNDVYNTRVATRFIHRRTDKLSVYGGVELGMAGEDAVSSGDSLYVGGALALRYTASPSFSLLMGVAGVSRFDDSAWVLPYIGFDWQMTEKLRLKTEAAEVHLDYDVFENWSVGLEAVYELRQYRLNENGPLNGGSFRDEEIRVGGRLGWQVTENVRFSLSGGKMLWREMRFYDGNAGFMGETELSKATYLSMGLTASF